MAPKSDDDVPVGGVHRTWVQVKEFLRTFDSWSEYRPIEDFELEAQHWASVGAKVLKELPWRFGRVAQAQAGALDSYAKWFQQPMPESSQLIAFENVCLAYTSEQSDTQKRLRQVVKNRDNDCYVYLSIKINYKPPEDARRRMSLALNQSHAGNPTRRFKIMAGEALGLLGLCKAQRCNMARRSGANSKSLLSDLWANLLWDQHHFVSQSVFEIYE